MIGKEELQNGTSCMALRVFIDCDDDDDSMCAAYLTCINSIRDTR